MVHSFLRLKIQRNEPPIWNACENSAPGIFLMECLSKRVKTFLMQMEANLLASSICLPEEAQFHSKLYGWDVNPMPLSSILLRISSNSVPSSIHRNMDHHW